MTLDFPPIEGGIARYLSSIIAHLPVDLVEVIALAVPGAVDFDQRQAYPINRLSVPSRWERFKRELKFFAPFFLARLRHMQNVQMIVCGQAHFSLLIPAWLISRYCGTPYAVFTYGLDLLYPQKTFYRRLFNQMLRDARIVFADSRAAREILIALAVAKAKTAVVHPPVDLRLADNMELPASPLRLKLGLSNKRCLLTVGRLVERKGHDTVIRTLPRLLAQAPDLHYLVVGKGEHERALRSLVEALHLKEHVTFVGYVPDNELSAYYALADVFVMMSREIPERGEIEGFGIVFLEAALHRLPVVAGNSGGVPEAVVHQQTGILVEPQDQDALYEALLKILCQPAFARRLGESGYKRAIAEFSSESAAAKVMAVLKGEG